MRVLAPLMLVALVMLNTFGFYLSFFAQQGALQRSASTRKVQQQYIELTPAQFKQVTWLREGKECRLNGNLYDIAKIETGANGVKLYVEEDFLEAGLISGFIDTLLGQEKEQGKAPLKLVPEDFFTDFIITSNTFLFGTKQRIIPFCMPGEQFSSYIGEVQSPPPSLA